MKKYICINIFPFILFQIIGKSINCCLAEIGKVS